MSPRGSLRSMKSSLEEACARSENRFDLVSKILRLGASKSLLEVGVWEGQFISQVVSRARSLRVYVGVDPWRQLADWNKPLNRDSSRIQDAFRKAEVARGNLKIDSSFYSGTTL